jgi:hypothetical protein
MTGILQILFASYAAADTTITADFLVVAGGEFTAQTLDVGTAYTVTVGAGGAGSTQYRKAP